MLRIPALVAFAALFLLTHPPAVAGPPCVCWELEIGDHESLPIKDFGLAAGYTPMRAASETLERLSDLTLPTVVRLETLRRATICVHDDAAASRFLLSRLLARALTAETGTKPASAAALGDAAYLVACFHQMGRARDLDGYPWLARAIGRAEKPAGLNLAAALVTLIGTHPQHASYATHVAEAKKGAAADPLLRRNVELLEKRAPAVLGHFRKKSG